MLRTSRFHVLALAAAATCGCASYRAQPLVPGQQLTDLRQRNLHHFVVERARPGADGHEAESSFDVTDGLSEAELVAVALTLNPELRAKRLAVGEASAALITAGLWPNPEVGVGIRPGIAGSSGTVVEADALFQLLRLGERDARMEVAQAHTDEVRADVVADEFRMVAEVREQRLTLLAADRLVALQQEAVDLRQRAFDLVRRQRELGEANVLATSAAELELAESRRELRRAQFELAAERRGLNQLLGLPPEYETKLTGLGDPLPVIVFDDLSDDELDRRVLAGRLELRSSEAAYERSEQELRLAVLQQFPRLGIGPGYERELDGSESLGLALSLEIPLFDRNQGEIAEKRTARERARAEYVALLHRLRAEAVAARATVRAAKDEVDAQDRDILPLLQQNQSLFEGAYRAREINIIDWITAQERALRAKREYLDALVRYRRAVIRLEAATGNVLSATSEPTTKPS